MVSAGPAGARSFSRLLVQTIDASCQADGWVLRIGFADRRMTAVGDQPIAKNRQLAMRKM